MSFAVCTISLLHLVRVLQTASNYISPEEEVAIFDLPCRMSYTLEFSHVLVRGG